mmetsp:Transcript_56887/g.123076  ORF Transcript_56887/g.123076 Transcript_56887/m.123076 type:complete len:98 (+) Transcript_56887:1347-1640(+)
MLASVGGRGMSVSRLCCSLLGSTHFAEPAHDIEGEQWHFQCLEDLGAWSSRESSGPATPGAAAIAQTWLQSCCAAPNFGAIVGSAGMGERDALTVTR